MEKKANEERGEEGGWEGGRERTYLGKVNAFGGVLLSDLVDFGPPIRGAHVLQLVLLLELFQKRVVGGMAGGVRDE